MVGDDPKQPNTLMGRPGEDRKALFNVIRNAGFTPAIQRVCLGLRYVKTVMIDHRTAVAIGIAQEKADLAALDATCGSKAPSGHAG